MLEQLLSEPFLQDFEFKSSNKRTFTVHLILLPDLMGHFFVCGWRQNIAIGID